MPSETGFGYANIDVGLFDDTKMKRLCRLLGDADRINNAIVLYVSAILASWSEASPASIEDSAPLWTFAPDDIIDALKKVGLIDDDGRIPAESFDHWFGPARDRKVRAQAASAAAHAARYGSDRSASAVPPQSDRTARLTVRHTDSYNAGGPVSAGAGPRPRKAATTKGPERIEGESMTAFMTRIGVPVPEVATEKETMNGSKNGAESGSDDHGKSRRRTKRDPAASG